MTKTLSNVYDGIFYIFKFQLNYILYCGCTSGMRSQSIAYLLIESERIYWSLGLEVEVHSTWVLCIRRPSRMYGYLFYLKSSMAGGVCRSCLNIFMGLHEVVGRGSRSSSYHKNPSSKNTLGVL